MIKVLGLALYGPLAASTRYRMGQYVPGLAELGIDLRLTGLLGDDYLRRRFNGGGLPLAAMVHDGAERLKQLHHLGEFDLAMLYCELFPFMPGWLERVLIRKPYIYDMDDAFYLRYRLGRKRIARSVLGDKFDSVMAGAAAVTAGNSVLAEYALKHNPAVRQIPTVVDTTRYVPVTRRQNPVFTVGWIGSPSTASYLPELVAPLAALGAEAPLNFVVIGGKAPAIPNVNVIEVEWQEHTEVDLINTFDVGVMPLPDDDWARGKCAFKLIQYMACAVPVVASPVGANADVVTPECGLMAITTDEWVQALKAIRDDAGLRQRMGEAGRQRVVEHYSLHTALPKLAEVIYMAAGN
ncbi:MAG: glycosyltransferase family 4 protein [Burkholderiaceae bacterium]|nr:glycosyltransferase family 4 protein [Burkholderiaceae bacterium]